MYKNTTSYLLILKKVWENALSSKTSIFCKLLAFFFPTIIVKFCNYFQIPSFYPNSNIL